MTAKPTYEELERQIQQLQKTKSERNQREDIFQDGQYRWLVENANELILVAQDGLIRFVNQKAFDYLGYSPEELKDRPFIPYIYPEDRKKVSERHLKRLKGEDLPGVYPFRVVDRDGKVRWMEINAVLSEWNGKPATFNYIDDITGRKRAEDTLRKSEHLTKSIIQFSQDIIVFKDNNYIFRLVNPAFCNLVGKAENEIIGKTDFDIFPYEFAKKYRNDDKSVIESGQSINIEEEVSSYDGTRYVSTAKAPVLNENNTCQGIVAIVRDITERKRAEKVLIESEALLRGMFNDHSAVMLLIDPGTGRIVNANQASSQYYGYPLENIIQMNIRQLNFLSPTEIAEKIAGAVNKQVNIFEFQHVLADGQVRDVEVHSTPITIQNQTLLFSIIHDITKRKWAEKALKESEGQLQSTIDGLSAHIAVLNERGEIVLTNKAYRDFGERNGVEPGTVSEGANYLAVCDTASGGHSEEANAFANGIREVLSGKSQSFELEYPCHSPDEKRWFIGRVTPFTDECTRRVVIAHEDITERIRAAMETAKLEAQNQQLQKSESLGRMAGAIAHHFNNQLSVVIGNLELFLDDFPDDAENRDLLFQSFKAGRKAAEVSQQMLTYLGQTLGTHEPMDLSESCRQSLSLLEVAIPKGLILNVDFPDSGPVIRADEGQIQQILTHLITNAWESISGNQGRIGLTIRTVAHGDVPSRRIPIDWQPQPLPYACIQVSDTGCGIPNEDIEKLFDPFFTTKFTGRGMGLAVVMGIVKAHGGSITVDSESGCGSFFRIYLPISTEKILLPLEPEKPMAALAQKVEKSGTVLLIEDEAMIRNTTKIMLSRFGYTVIDAKDGVEALEIFQQRQNEVCCVISDLTMPRMGGWETLTELRKIQNDVRVILASGHNKDVVMAGDHPEQPQAFLYKPYSMSELKEALEKAMEAIQR